MDWGTVALLLVIIACPLMMLLMMGHGRGGAGHRHGHDGDPLAGMSDEDLRELADRAERELDRRHDDTSARRGA